MKKLILLSILLIIGCEGVYTPKNITYIWTSYVGYLDENCSNEEFNGFCVEAYQNCMTAINTGKTLEGYECTSWGWSAMTEVTCDSLGYTWNNLNDDVNASVTIILNSDGTCSITEAAECKNTDHEGYNTQSICEAAGYEWNNWMKSGTWTESGNIVTLTLNSYGSNAYDATMEFTKIENSLIMEYKELDDGRDFCNKLTFISNP